MGQHRLREIQHRLCSLYDVTVAEDVLDFVCDAEVAGGERLRGEVLVVVEDDNGVSVGLYVDPDALEALVGHDGDAWLDDARVQAACLATEGVSHFVYLAFRAANDEPVRQLELELQAEVDKYASALLGESALEGLGVGVLKARSRAVRARLFGAVRFLDDAASEEGERYRLAHRHAANYARSLEARFVDAGDLPALVRELRLFYRLNLEGKLDAASDRELR